MIERYTCRVVLTVLGPFLTAATGPDLYGIDKSFHKDDAGNLIVPAAHVKGKLRMALEELQPFLDEQALPDMRSLFGEGSAPGTYEPRPGALRFADFVAQGTHAKATRTRVTIDHATQTASRSLLRAVEDPFASGAEVGFAGEVEFSATDQTAAQAIANVIRVGFSWLANLGAEKGVGFGRLKAVSVGKPVPAPSNDTAAQTVAAPSLHLRIKADEPLLVGKVKSRRTNYILSRIELPGGLIKGALAAALSAAKGDGDRTLDPGEAASYPGYEALVQHFSEIRVTHALPAPQGAARPVRRPISIVERDGKQRGDLALSTERYPLLPEGSPAYFADAKNWNDYKGATKPRVMFETRSEIDDASQRAAKGRLFTYGFLMPTDEGQRTVEWICNVDLVNIADERARAAAAQQFARAAGQHLQRLGKLARRVTVEVCPGPAPAAMACKSPIEDGLAVITLQADAVMLSPDEVRSLPLEEDLTALYAAYWTGISNRSLVLEDFFAHQGFEGGYLYHRYLGASEREETPDAYRPYYLTRAGSVFRLRAVDPTGAQDAVERWQAVGLPLPAWALAEYGAEAWRNCPFVPENGYGEIVANLAYHWDHRL